MRPLFRHTKWQFITSNRPIRVLYIVEALFVLSTLHGECSGVCLIGLLPHCICFSVGHPLGNSRPVLQSRRTNCIPSLNMTQYTEGHWIFWITHYVFFIMCASLRCQSNEIPQDRCEPLTTAMCQGMPYDSVVWPNLLGHTSQEEASLELQQMYPLVQTQCSPHLLTFLCVTYMPVCTVITRAIPPCRRLCRQAEAGCAPVLIEYGFDWPEIWACENFPEDDMCVPGDVAPEPETVPEIPTTTPLPDFDGCKPIASSMCAGMTFIAGGFPSQIGDLDPIQAARGLGQWQALGVMECSPFLRLFLCSAHFPLCTASEGPLVLPTRELCQLARSGCAQEFNKLGFEWPQYVSCDSFQDQSCDTKIMQI